MTEAGEMLGVTEGPLSGGGSRGGAESTDRRCSALRDRAMRYGAGACALLSIQSSTNLLINTISEGRKKTVRRPL